MVADDNKEMQYVKNKFETMRNMKQCIIKGASLLSATILGMSLSFAQNIILTLEAENGQLTPPVKVKPEGGGNVDGFSGGKYVGDNDPGSVILFTDVEIPESGTYQFKTYYISAQHRSIAIKINNYPDYVSAIVTPTVDWNEPPVGVMTTYVYMDKGKNTIKITPHPMGQGGPNLDKFEILTTDVELPEPGNFPIVLEAEAAQLFGDLKAKPLDGTTISGLSGGRYIGDFNLNANSYLRFSDVEVPEAGTYELKVYSMGSNRPLTIKVNHYQKSIIRTLDSPNWDNAPASMVSTLVYLDKGKNTFTFGLHEDNGPNLDKFEIHLTEQTIEIPPVEKITFGYDHTDEAEITAQHINETLPLLTDNDEYTIYNPGEVNSTNIVAKCKQPILLTGFLFSGGIGSTQDVLNWKLSVSKDGQAWSMVTASRTIDLNGAHLFEIDRYPGSAAGQAAQYYQLEVNGDDIQIAEWQLFGVPYLENTDGCNFPADIVSGLSLEDKASAYPEGSFGDGWSERFYNVFDRSMSTKYYAHESKQFYIQIDLDKAYILQSYSLTSAADFPDRDPKKWILNAYNAELGWIELDRQTEYTFPCRYATMNINVNSDLEFSKFMIDVESNNGSGDIQLLNWQLFGEECTGSNIKPVESGSITLLSNQGNITIIQQDNKPLKYAVYNLSGMKIKQDTMNDYQQTIPLEKGMYIVSLINEEGSVNKKIIVK